MFTPVCTAVVSLSGTRCGPFWVCPPLHIFDFEARPSACMIFTRDARGRSYVPAEVDTRLAWELWPVGPARGDYGRVNNHNHNQLGELCEYRGPVAASGRAYVWCLIDRLV